MSQRRRSSIIECFAVTDRGLLRPTNQDAAFAACHQRRVVLAVADGMGGIPGGDRASALAIAALERPPDATEPPAEFLRRRLVQADAAIAEAQQAELSYASMGTTLVAAIVDGGSCWLINVGDSRAYLWQGHPGASASDDRGTLSALTADHSMAAAAVRAGTLTADDARYDDRRHQLTRVVGGREPSGDRYGPVRYDDASALLLVSDGVTGPLADADIARVLAEHCGRAAAQALVAAALDAGGPDNIAVAIADWRC